MKKIVPLMLVGFFVFALIISSHAQCAMCTATAESSRDAGSTVAESINKGVLYIFMMPYIIIGTVGYFWWREKKKAEAEQAAA